MVGHSTTLENIKGKTSNKQRKPYNFFYIYDNHDEIKNTTKRISCRPTILQK